MRGAVIHAPGDVRFEQREDPEIVAPSDAIIRLVATCICGSDLWSFRGADQVTGPTPLGHEYVGVVEAVGEAVETVKPGQFVVGSFAASDNTCPICRSGYQTHCVNRVFMDSLGAQAELLRVPLADGTLVATPDLPEADLVPSLLAASDVLGTGWFAADAAGAGPGKTVAVVGDGAVGLLGVLAAKHLGAERVIAVSRHESRQRLALEFGATDIIIERGDAGVAKVKQLTDGLGAHSVIEAVGTQESMMQAIGSTRPGGHARPSPSPLARLGRWPRVAGCRECRRSAQLGIVLDVKVYKFSTNHSRAPPPRPASRAATIACARSEMCSFAKMFEMWLLTVLPLMNRRDAICWLSIPDAIRSRTARSRSVRDGNGRTDQPCPSACWKKLVSRRAIAGPNSASPPATARTVRSTSAVSAPLSK